jgi:hypothetical protein
MPWLLWSNAKNLPTHMDQNSNRIAWLRLALGEILSSPDMKSAKVAAAALDADDRELREGGKGKERTLPIAGTQNPWLAED